MLLTHIWGVFGSVFLCTVLLLVTKNSTSQTPFRQGIVTEEENKNRNVVIHPSVKYTVAHYKNTLSVE